MSYKDMTFCQFWQKCERGKNCHRAWTPDKEADARKCMEHPQVCFYSDRPECFIALDIDNVNMIY